MGSKQFSQTIQTDTDVSVNTSTETLTEAVGLNNDGSNYPYTVDPDGDIREIVITACDDIVMHCWGDGFTADEWDVHLKGGTGSFESWELEKVEFRDPNETAAPLSAVISHE